METSLVDEFSWRIYWKLLIVDDSTSWRIDCRRIDCRRVDMVSFEVFKLNSFWCDRMLYEKVNKDLTLNVCHTWDKSEDFFCLGELKFLWKWCDALALQMQAKLDITRSFKTNTSRDSDSALHSWSINHFSLTYLCSSLYVASDLAGS